MDRIFWLIIGLILFFIAIQILIKITSLVVKIFIWCAIGFLCLYMINYLVFPIIKIKPLPVKEFIYKQITKKDINKNIDQEIDKEIESKVKPIIEKIDKNIKQEK